MTHEAVFPEAGAGRRGAPATHVRKPVSIHFFKGKTDRHQFCCWGSCAAPSEPAIPDGPLCPTPLTVLKENWCRFIFQGKNEPTPVLLWQGKDAAIPGPRPTLFCTFPEDFLQVALDTVCRRTVAVQTVQHFRLVLFLHKQPSPRNDEAATAVGLSARQVQRRRSRWVDGDFSVGDVDMPVFAAYVTDNTGLGCRDKIVGSRDSVIHWMVGHGLPVAMATSVVDDIKDYVQHKMHSREEL